MLLFYRNLDYTYMPVLISIFKNCILKLRISLGEIIIMYIVLCKCRAAHVLFIASNNKLSFLNFVWPIIFLLVFNRLLTSCTRVKFVL